MIEAPVTAAPRIAAPEIEHWGLVPYAEAWERQRQRQRELIAGTSSPAIVFCEHPPTITAGTSTQESSYRVPPQELLSKHGIEFFEVERGGDLTFHGPGQLVCYPLLNLTHYRRDVHWYMRLLEEGIIQTCAQFGVSTTRIQGKTGVWISRDEGGTTTGGVNPAVARDRKIASIGVRLSRWCSMHGLSLNVLKQPSFSLIVPCGLADITVTSLEEERLGEKQLTGTGSSGEVVSVAAVQEVLSKQLLALLAKSKTTE